MPKRPAVSKPRDAGMTGRPSEELMARRRPRPTVREESDARSSRRPNGCLPSRDLRARLPLRLRNALACRGAALYFPTKETLYRAVIGRVLTAWLAAASSFDASEDPTVALSAYIGAKMDLAREMPLATRIWSAEIMRGAPMIQHFLTPR